MSGLGNDPRAGAADKNPALRFLAGCAIVAGVLAAIAIAGAVLVGWRLARDEAPGRVRERFLVGDENRYWRVDLKPGDAGLTALFERFEQINETTRRSVLRGTFLESFPFPRRRARLDELAPFTLEVSLVASDPSEGLQRSRGWAARGTFSHGILRLRAVFKVMRWVMGRDPAHSATIDVGGIAVTEVRDKNGTFALATAGDRVVAASDATRMREILAPASDAEPSPLAELHALHDSVELAGEDAWAFISQVRAGGLSRPLVIDEAAGSFDVNDHDELAFKIAVAHESAVEEGSGFRGTREDCLAVATFFLPGIPAEAIELDGEGARRVGDARQEFSGRIAGLSKRVADLLAKTTTIRRREREDPEPESPSANPIPPSLPPPGDPRSGTPAGPRREGTPTPRR